MITALLSSRIAIGSEIGHRDQRSVLSGLYELFNVIKCYRVPLSNDLNTFQILRQKFVKFFVGYLENFRHLKDILKLIDLQRKYQQPKGSYVIKIKIRRYSICVLKLFMGVFSHLLYSYYGHHRRLRIRHIRGKKGGGRLKTRLVSLSVSKAVQ